MGEVFIGIMIFVCGALSGAAVTAYGLIKFSVEAAKRSKIETDKAVEDARRRMTERAELVATGKLPKAVPFSDA